MVFSKNNIIIELTKREKTILWNPLVGAMISVNPQIGKIFEKRSLTDLKNLSTTTIDEFLKSGLLYRNAEEEDTRIIEMYHLFNEVMSEKAMSFVLVPTYSCNFKCPYCFEKDEIKNNNSIISDQVIDKAFTAMNILKNEKLFAEKALALFGGEPLIDMPGMKEKIEKILDRARILNFKHIKIVTNGSTIQKYLDLLRKYDVDTIQITIDGPKNIHDKRRFFKDGKGSFDLIMDNIKSLLESNFGVHLRINLDLNNLEHLPGLIEIFSKENFFSYENLHIAPAVVGELGQGRNYSGFTSISYILEKLLLYFEKDRSMKGNLSLAAWPGAKYIQYVVDNKRPYIPIFSHCDSNFHTYALDLYGDIYTCPDIIGRKEYSVGNFLPELSLKSEELRKWRNRTIFNLKDCSKCSYATICGGGCTLEAINKFNSPTHNFCTKSELEKILELLFDFYYDELFQ